MFSRKATHPSIADKTNPYKVNLIQEKTLQKVYSI